MQAICHLFALMPFISSIFSHLLILLLVLLTFLFICNSPVFRSNSNEQNWAVYGMSAQIPNSQQMGRRGLVAIQQAEVHSSAHLFCRLSGFLSVDLELIWPTPHTAHKIESFYILCQIICWHSLFSPSFWDALGGWKRLIY